MIAQDTFGIRGKPHGHFGRWNLNSDGFRGPELASSPPPGCTRVMILGASESFGHDESPGQEYPAQLADSLQSAGCFEVVNAAVIGLPLPGIERLWTNWASRYRPQIVVIYPTPSFYLDSMAPKARRPTGATSVVGSPLWASRMLQRARSVRILPRFVGLWWRRHNQRLNDVRHASDWLFREAPPERIAQFTLDLDSLVRQVRRLGAHPILVTHATRFHRPLAGDDQAVLDDWRRFAPRATGPTILAFEDSARAAVGTIAARLETPLVDASRLMGGNPQWFTDHQHFSNAGAGYLAGLLAHQIQALRLPPGSPAK
jgi:hypothetical protein